MSEKRNIVLITLDSLRADHCSFMGYKRKTTPTLDKMAKEGLYYENAITSGVGTPASMVCTFTGDYCPVNPQETRPGPWRKVLSKRKTLAQALSEVGYHTGAIHPNPFASRYYGFNKGFDYFQDFLLPENESMFSKVSTKVRGFKRGKLAILRNFLNLIQKEEVFKTWETYYGEIIDWVKQAEKPFFLWVLLLDTHHPYLAPKKFRSGGFLDYYDLVSFSWKGQKENWRLNLSEEKQNKIIDAYDDTILHADRFIESLWEDLKDEDPIFIIHADHGDGFGEHGFYSHPSYLYEELIHIPLVIYNADVKGKVEKPVSLIDLPSTVMRMIGEENKFPSQNSLEGGDWVIAEIAEDDRKKVAVRMKDWKFITGQGNTDELYNLNKYPLEQYNLVKDYPDFIKEIKRIVKYHIKQETERSETYKEVSSIGKVL